MKNKIYITGILLAVITILSSCKKDDDPVPATSNSTFISAITSGSWKVNYFYESGSNHTNDFNGYVFVFNSDKTMTATVSGTTNSGTWKIDDDGSNEFHVDIGNTSPLNDINKGWLIYSQSSTNIQLKDDHASHNEELHFVKI